MKNCIFRTGGVGITRTKSKKFKTKKLYNKLLTTKNLINIYTTMQTSSQQSVGGATIQQQQQQQQQQHQQSNTPPISTSNNNNNSTNTNTNTNSTTTPPQHFCLRWNNYQTNLTNVFDQLLQNESFVDVTLACDGHSVKAHKMVLSACSPYFQSLFFDNPCQHPIIIMRDIKWPELKAAVEFMYKGEINVSQEQIGPLLKVAESLKIRGLADVNGGGVNENESLLATTAPTAPTNYHQKSSSASSSSSLNNNRPRSRSNRSNMENSWQSPTNPSENRIPMITPPSQHHLSHHPDDFDDDNMQIATSPQSIGGAGTPPSTLTPRLTNNSLSKKRRRYSNEQRSRESSSCRSSPAIGGADRSGGGDNIDYQHQIDLSSPMQQQQQHRDMLHSPSSSVGGGGVVPTPPPPPLVAPPPPPTPSHTPRTPTLSTPGPTPTPPGLVGAGGTSLSVSICNDRERSTPVQLSMFNEQMSQLSRQMSGDGGPMSSPSASSVVAAHHHQQQLAAAAAAAAAAHHQLSLSGGGAGGGSNIHPDDMEIKPGIAEMIREEERAKLLESSHAWLGASTSSIAGNHNSYQYQLQSMWQKCWNTNQSLVHNLRFRERGPLKSWRPETMAEAIFSVLKEGLSLSQAARKYDIPYPTFVLYANRVHNMLGPSADGGADLRPKGRGRPQRILLGVWPDEHIRGVIRAVVFRDSHQAIKEEAQLAAAYPRLHDGLSIHSYGTPGSCSSNGGPDPSVSPGAAAAAAVAAVAQGLRQQMCSMVAAAQHHGGGSLSGLIPGMMSRGSPTDSAHDLRISPAGSPLDTPLSSPLALVDAPALNLATIGSSVEVGIGVSGMAYKPPRRYSTPTSERSLFQDEIEDLVKSPLELTSPRMTQLPTDPKDVQIKMEPMTECRSE
ncbi:protein bric-a-brac 1-like isoform X2 [Chrysoperla carnea]|uniref:protein bric-a-brac 1-like isoform X2 n=1 Tax=Chrysoperla carnea TaxID=189513 RepID=UPI001D070FC8|nr:protein bric-a-brac 1-like isoform X2 [Chrysoperla carnea]